MSHPQSSNPLENPSLPFSALNNLATLNKNDETIHLAVTASKDVDMTSIHPTACLDNSMEELDIFLFGRIKARFDSDFAATTKSL